MTAKHVTEMNEAERAETLAALKRPKPPEPMPDDRHARDMTAIERIEWLRQYQQRLP